MYTANYLMLLWLNLSEERKKLKEAADTLSFVEKVLGGTYVQSLVEQEDYRVTSDYIPRGVWKA